MSKKIDVIRAVQEFHYVYDVPVGRTPELPDAKRRKLRRDLIDEEFNEYLDAEDDNDLIGIADALADIIYVCVGCAIEYGIPLAEVFTEIHRSNLSKLGAGGEVLRREDGKVIKGQYYSPPDLKPIIENAKQLPLSIHPAMDKNTA